MEKNTPHCKLVVVKSFIAQGKVGATLTAFNGASELGLYSLEDMCSVVLGLKTTDFYKSMTTVADHRVWQDVYRARTPSGRAVYLKLCVMDEVLIVSFKGL